MEDWLHCKKRDWALGAYRQGRGMIHLQQMQVNMFTRVQSVRETHALDLACKCSTS